MQLFNTNYLCKNTCILFQRFKQLKCRYYYGILQAFANNYYVNDAKIIFYNVAKLLQTLKKVGNIFAISFNDKKK